MVLGAYLAGRRMAIRHHATVLCDYLIRADNGRFTLAGIFQNIQATELPCVKDPLAIYVQLEGDPGDHYELLLRYPNGEELLLESEPVGTQPALREHQQWATTVVAVASAVFVHPGTYAVVLRSQGADVHTYTFGVLAPAGPSDSPTEEDGV